MGRSPCCSKEGLNRGAWTAQEDNILREYIRTHGEGKWRDLPRKAGLKRCGKSCRLRWLNYLRPDIKRGNISAEEEELIIRLHKLLGNRWSLIAGRLPGRTDNEIKNYWNTNLGKKVQTAPTRKLSRHSYERNSTPAKLNVASNVTASSPSSSKMASHMIIRTKAFRFSEVRRLTPQPNKSEHFETTLGEGEGQPILEYGHHSVRDRLESGAYDQELPSFTCAEDNDHSSDFLMNMNMGDICLSDLLDSDFSDIFNFNYCEENGNELSRSPSSDEPAMLSEQVLLQDWSSNSCDQANVSAPTLQSFSFSSFLHSEGEWQGE